MPPRLKAKPIVFILAAVVFAGLFQNCGDFAGQTDLVSQTSLLTDSRPSPENDSTPDNTPATLVCTPPRHYQYTIRPGEEIALLCASNSTDIINVKVPDTGRALGRAQLVLRNGNTNAIYYWSAQVLVGNAKVAYSVGDDICPNASTSIKSIFGYGELSAQNQTVRVAGYQGSAPCTDQQVTVFSGGSLDIWVEDPNPACQGRDSGLVSSYDSLGLSAVFNWSTSMSQILKLEVPSSPRRENVMVFSAVEGTPLANPNKICGFESATLVSQIRAGGEIVAVSTGVIPASEGMGPLVLSSAETLQSKSIPLSRELLVGSNTGATTVTTGGCCGDAKLGFVRY